MGSLLLFPRNFLNGWSAMDMLEVTKAMNRLIKQTEELHQLADELPVRVRAKVMRVHPVNFGVDYQPWGGLFPHPRYKEEP